MFPLFTQSSNGLSKHRTEYPEYVPYRSPNLGYATLLRSMFCLFPKLREYQPITSYPANKQTKRQTNADKTVPLPVNSGG